MPKIRSDHAIGTGYDDSVTQIAQPLGEGLKGNVQDAIVAIDARLDALQPAAPSNLSGALDVSTLTLVSGFLSSGAPNVFLGGSYPAAGDSSTAIFRSVPITPATPATTQFANADKGTLHLYVNGVAVDSYDLEASFNPAESHGAQSYTPDTSGGGLITIESVEWYNNFALYQRGEAHANLAALNLQAGTNRIQFRHEPTTGVFHNSTELVLFYDTGTTPPTVTALTAFQIAPLVGKFLSGVKYYTIGDDFEVHAAISGVFNNTYASSAAQIIGSQFGITDTLVAWDDPFSSGHGTPGAVGDGWAYDNTDGLIISIAGVYNIDAKLQIVGRDPFGNSAPFSMTNSEDHLVHTKVATSTSTKKEFWDEDYRLKPVDPGTNTYPNNYELIADADADGTPVTGQSFDSTAALSNGNAIHYNSALRYPTINYNSGYAPTNSANYSGFTGEQSAYYCMAVIGNLGQGRLQLAGITSYAQIEEGNPAQKVRVELRFPQVDGGSSEWWNLGVDFVPAKPVAQGDGVHFAAQDVPASGIFGWNIGTLNSASSGQKYFVKVTLLDNTAPAITKIEHSNVV